jgi:hypothetical protein
MQGVLSYGHLLLMSQAKRIKMIEQRRSISNKHILSQ